jgi:chemotaxis protein methyltransferase CheR
MWTALRPKLVRVLLWLLPVADLNTSRPALSRAEPSGPARPDLAPDFVAALRAAWLERIAHREDALSRESFAEALASAIEEGDIEPHPRAIDAVRFGALHGRVLQALARRLLDFETRFFASREADETLARDVLPELVWSKRNERRLRIWSAGCASGEELYSLIVLLSRAVEDIEDFRLTLVGSDINQEALRRARAAVYTRRSLDGVSALYRRTLFVERGLGERGTEFELADRYRRDVYFVLDNLTDSHTTDAEFDLILSSNVSPALTDSGLARWARKLTSARARNGIIVTAPEDPTPRTIGRTRQLSGLSVHRALKSTLPPPMRA